MINSATPDPLRFRRRLAEEWLLESSRWRDDLTDEQAQKLLFWAKDYVNTVIEETAVLPDDEAEDAIDGAATAVLQVMRDVNKLTPLLNQLDEKSARQQLQKLNTDLLPISLPLIPEEKIEQIVYQYQFWNTQTTFDTLHQMLTWQIEEKTTEEEE